VENNPFFVYLGATISHGTSSVSEDIHRRIGKAAATFGRSRRVWEKDISTQTKVRIYNATVLSVLLYASETWRLLADDIKALETFQMSCLRRILGMGYRGGTVYGTRSKGSACSNQPPRKLSRGGSGGLGMPQGWAPTGPSGHDALDTTTGVEVCH
jgi:hypothetical protein